MVWVYNDPLTQDEKRAADYLQKHLKKREYIDKIVKILSLFNYLKSKRFRNSNELRNDVLAEKGKPLFDEVTASKVYKALYKKRGGSNEYAFTESLIRGMGTYLKGYDRIGISWVIDKGLFIATLPVKGLKALVGEGIYDLASGATHGLVETGVSGVNGVAETVGGPIGLAVVALFTAIAAAVGACLAIAEGAFAQAFVHFINFIPGIGPALVKGINKVENMAKIVDKDRDQISKIPFVGESVVSAVPNSRIANQVLSEPTGGKRFSVRRRIRTKWPKTQRQRFARH